MGYFETLIFTDLSGLNDLHLHCLPRLQTLMLNCNQITSFKGLDKLTSVQAIVLDHNQIKDIPFNTFVGCKCLKYLHLDHNKIACLPRLPHLNNLAALHLGYNRIQVNTEGMNIFYFAIFVSDKCIVDYCSIVINRYQLPHYQWNKRINPGWEPCSL